MKKKIISLMLATTMCASVMAGCGNSASDAGSADAAKEEKEYAVLLVDLCLT